MAELESPFLTRIEAAEFLRFSVSQLDYLARKGEIPRAKFGEGPRSRVLYRAKDLEAYVDSHLDNERKQSKQKVLPECQSSTVLDCGTDWAPFQRRVPDFVPD